MARSPVAQPSRAGGPFARLARAVVRRPLVPILVWVVLLVAAVPFLHLLGGVTTNSSESLPANAPSSQAGARFAQLFPDASQGPSDIVLLYGSNLTDAAGQAIVTAVTAALVGDRALVDVAGISNVYRAYSAYLLPEVELAGGGIAAALNSSPTLPQAVNSSAPLLWGPPATFLAHWEALANNTTGPPDRWNSPAYNATAATYANSTLETEVLSAFYSGAGTSHAGFNGSAACANASSLAGVVACANTVARANLGALVGQFPLPEQPAAAAALEVLGTANYSGNWSATRSAGAVVVGSSLGLPGAWVDRVWSAFPTGAVPAVAAAAFANGTVASATLAAEPLPVPFGLRASYVNAADTASLIVISFGVADDYTNASGGDPVDADLASIATVGPAALRAADPSGSVGFAQTGGAALDELTQEAVNSSLALVLPLTVGLLLAISMVYFRSPVTPLVTFSGLAIALVLGLGATVLIGTWVTHVDSSALTLEEVFVLGVGTDYSIFLVARYREEILAGKGSDEAIVASLTWAGQSVATSGSTAILVTAALAFSGVALLSQWGMVLSVAILITMLLSLTIVPACLKLLGPRIFWPTSGPRLARQAAASADRIERRATYFYRAGRLSARRPRAIVATLLLVTVPLAAVALTVPISYDFYGQLPSGHPATVGLARLADEFGPGFSTQSFALVTFSQPLIASGRSSALEFHDLSNLTALANGTAGISAVQSPVGPYGAPLTQWLAYGSLPPAQQEALVELAAQYVGSDHRTVVLTLETSSTGLSEPAVTAVDAVRGAFRTYAGGHPEVSSISLGGGAPVIEDLANQTNEATLLMLLAVTVGLVVVLLAVLRSWIIALMAVGTIGLSIAWAWALTYLLFDQLAGFPLFFYVRTILVVLVLGLGIDYNIFLLTRVREERLRGRSAGDAATEAVARTGGIITAAAVILASAFAALTVGEFTLIRAIGFSVALAVILDAMVVRTYLVPASLQLLGDRVWRRSGRRGRSREEPPDRRAQQPPDVPAATAERSLSS